jgi:hypothetical protein
MDLCHHKKISLDSIETYFDVAEKADQPESTTSHARTKEDLTGENYKCKACGWIVEKKQALYPHCLKHHNDTPNNIGYTRTYEPISSKRKKRSSSEKKKNLSQGTGALAALDFKHLNILPPSRAYKVLQIKQQSVSDKDIVFDVKLAIKMDYVIEIVKKQILT